MEALDLHLLIDISSGILKVAGVLVQQLDCKEKMGKNLHYCDHGHATTDEVVVRMGDAAENFNPSIDRIFRSVTRVTAVFRSVLLCFQGLVDCAK